MESRRALKDKDQDLPLLTNLNYEAWAPKCLDRLLAYPGPWEWLKSGEEPLFITPPLEIPRVWQRQQAPAAGRGRENEGGRGAGGRQAGKQARERQRARDMAALAEEEDEDAGDARRGDGGQEEAQMVRNSMFPGEGGKEMWKELLRSNWAYIVRNIDDSINDKIVIMNDYDVHDSNHNVLFLWNTCREIATGIGAQSAGVV